MMIDEDFDFGRPSFLHAQWGLLLLLLGLIVMGIFWWNDSIEKTQRIADLVKDNKRLSDRLADAESAADGTVFRTTAFKVSESEEPEPPTGTNELPKPGDVEVATRFDVDEFIGQVKRMSNPADLETLDHKADGIEAAITPLLALTEDNRYCENALVSLRMMTIPKRRSPEVVNALIQVIDSHHFSDVEESGGINRHAYAMMVFMGDEAAPAIDKLKMIMQLDHSPWAGYACVTLKLLKDEIDVTDRMVELLNSPFENNRLVVVRKLPEFVSPEIARRELEKMYPIESSDSIKTSIINSMNRIEDKIAGR